MERIAKKCFVVASLLFVSFLISSLPVKALFASTPINISQTNIRSDRFTISWVTDVEETCHVNYGTTSSLGKPAYDDRGNTTSSKTHHVTITDLSANKTYYYEIVSGGQTYRNNAQPYTINTGISLSPSYLRPCPCI